jgi:hypothetical protein
MVAKTSIAATIAAAAVAATTAGGAGAATPCWKKVQNDWFRHGRVVGHYKPLSCYLRAIKKLPKDVATYGGAAQDIRRAYLAEKKRLAALAKKKKHH